MKVLKLVVALLISLALAYGVLMFWKAYQSKSIQPQVGVVAGKLKACGEKPNCVSSSADPDSKFYIAPMQDSNIEGVWDDLNMLLTEPGFTIVDQKQNYIHATAATPLLGFIDDMEFLLEPENGLIHLRSQSRVGYSDMGANRKRLEKIKSKLNRNGKADSGA